MIPSSAATSHRRTPRRRNSNAGPGSASASASARALAAGLWRLRHADRMKAAGAQTQEEKQKGRRRRPASHLCHGNKRHCRCPSSSTTRRNVGILDKIDACLECPMAYGSSSMEKATKWDDGHSKATKHKRLLDGIFFTSSSSSCSQVVVELEQARVQVAELEEERRVMTKRLERFLRTLAEEKAAWKSRVRDNARRAAAALRDEARAEREHRRQLEQANARLVRELAEARSSAKQQAQSYETERKARELMEDACSELTREVEEDQAEVELLRRECLRMREEMEEERRMLQMAEVWREERVQMKLSDAKLALESKYTQLSRLQAEMEAFLARNKDSSALREARAISDAAATSCSQTLPLPERRPRSRAHHQHEAVDVDSVFDHFRRKERDDGDAGRRNSSPAPARASHASSSSKFDTLQSVSPATDLFLAKADDDDDDVYGGSSGDLESDGGRDSCSWVGTSDRSAASVANGNGGASRRSTWAGKNTALIRRLWRSAITESRNKATGTANGSPAPDRRSSVTTAEATPEGEQCSTSGSSRLPLPSPLQKQKQKQRQRQRQSLSLKEKLMEARMDDHRPLHAHAVKQKP